MNKLRLSTEHRAAIYVVVALALQWGILRALVWAPDRDISVDAPYHITMADLFGKLAWRRTFPHTVQSVWATHFADKELGFHLLLCSLRRWAGMLGYDGQAPPFILESTVLAAGLLTVFAVSLRTMRIRHVYVFLPLLLFGCPFFTLRVAMVRPHVMSIMLMVITAALLVDRAPLKRQSLRMGILGILFAYFHSNPHFVLIPTGCYAVAVLPWRGWREAVTPALAALGGVVVGLTLHPQFPNTFIIWKIQCVDVVWQTLTKQIPDISTPLEFKPPTFQHLWHNALLLMLPVLPIAAVIQRLKKDERVPASLRFLVLLSVLTTIGYFVSKRMIEYALPYSLMAVADVYNRRLGNRPLNVHVGAALAAVVIGASLTPLHKLYFEHSGIPMPRQFAEWARATLPAGSRIANLRWDDFPHIFFAAPEYAYSYGLDPMFAYVANPEDYLRIERISANKEPVPDADELQRLVQARIVYISIRHRSIARAFAKKNFALAYQGIDGWCFDLGAPSVDHRIEERLESW